MRKSVTVEQLKIDKKGNKKMYNNRIICTNRLCKLNMFSLRQSLIVFEFCNQYFPQTWLVKCIVFHPTACIEHKKV